MSNFKSLEDEGLIRPDDLFTHEQFDAIEKLTDEQVKTLIEVWKKLGPTFKNRERTLFGETIGGGGSGGSGGGSGPILP